MFGLILIIIINIIISSGIWVNGRVVYIILYVITLHYKI